MSPFPSATQSCDALSAEKASATGEAAGKDAEEADEGDEGEWEVAAKSHNAARRQKRKQARRANWAAAAAQRAAQADESKEDTHHLEGTADGGDSEGWETDGKAQSSTCVVQPLHMKRLGQADVFLHRQGNDTLLCMSFACC